MLRGVHVFGCESHDGGVPWSFNTVENKMVFIVSIWWLLVMNKIENDEIVLVLYIDKVLVDRWLNATEYVEHKPVSYLFFFFSH